MKKLVAALGVLFSWIATGLAEDYLINGGQYSQITYEMVQKVAPAPGTQKLVLSYVLPESFSSPTYRQSISAFRMDFSVPPPPRTKRWTNAATRLSAPFGTNPSPW